MTQNAIANEEVLTSPAPQPAPSPEHILQTGMAFWASKTLLSAVELELFTTLAEGPQNLSMIEANLGLHPRASRDFLDALVALGFLQRTDGVYSNTPSTELFLDKQKPSYVGGILEMANRRLFGHWNHLTEGLRTGQRQNEAARDGVDPFAAMYADPQLLKSFLGGMTGVSRGANLAIASKFPWSAYKTIVDIGPAQGDLLTQVLLKNEHLTGIGMDLPPVGPVFLEYVATHGLSSRVTFHGGSFFDEPLPKAEVVMMGHILHDWGLENKKLLVRKAYDALPEGGALLVYDAIIDDDRRKNAFGLLMSLNMLIETNEGYDYTGAECIEWMREAGFRETWMEHLVGPDSMVVGIK